MGLLIDDERAKRKVMNRVSRSKAIAETDIYIYLSWNVEAVVERTRQVYLS